MTTTYTPEPIPGSYVFEGSEQAPHVAILSGVHGDETPGIHATHKLLAALHEELDSIAGKVTLVLWGNIPAARANKRFLVKDMNRQFTEELIAEVRAKAEQGLAFCYEEGRPSQIARLIQDADVVLDIHATTKPTPTGFVVCTKDQMHWKLAKLLDGVGYVVLDPGTDGPLDQYMAKQGKTALTYESGHLSDKTVVPTIVQNCKTLLSLLGNAFPEHEATPQNTSPIPIEFYGKVEMQEPFLTPVDYRNFDLVEEGDIIAVTGGSKIIAQEKTHIVFPKKDPKPGDVALELARTVNPANLSEKLYATS